jgi:hypothetical protein
MLRQKHSRFLREIRKVQNPDAMRLFFEIGGTMEKQSEPNALSPLMKEIWPDVTYRVLILATETFIVFIGDDLYVHWKTNPKYDQNPKQDKDRFVRIKSRAIEVEAADRDDSNEKRTLNFKRQIGEAIARALEGYYDNAEEMLQLAERRHSEELQRRKDAIKEQIKVKDHWLTFRKTWTAIHYTIGIAALLFSTLAASKAEALGLSATMTAWFSWLTVICTAMLTFLSPERKSNKYARAWSILNNQIAQYQADYQVQLKEVIESYKQGESIIFDTGTHRRR